MCTLRKVVCRVCFRKEFTKKTVLIHKFAKMYFSYEITMRNTSSLRKYIYRCIEGVMSNCLSLHTMAVKETSVNMQYFL
jgi:hypothetical protein